MVIERKTKQEYEWWIWGQIASYGIFTLGTRWHQSGDEVFLGHNVSRVVTVTRFHDENLSSWSRTINRGLKWVGPDFGGILSEAQWRDRILSGSQPVGIISSLLTLKLVTRFSRPRMILWFSRRNASNYIYSSYLGSVPYRIHSDFLRTSLLGTSPLRICYNLIFLAKNDFMVRQEKRAILYSFGLSWEHCISHSFGFS